MDKDSKDALEETRAVLRDLASYLNAVDARSASAAHPSVNHFSHRIATVAEDLDAILEQPDLAGKPV